MAVTTNRLARGRRVRASLACIVSVATLSCGPKLVEDEKYSGEKALRRWSLTRAQKGKLAEGCRVWPDFPSFPSPAVPNDTYPAVKVGFVANDPLIYEDNLGLQAVNRSSVGKPLPTSDEFWCSEFEQHRVFGGSIAGLECIAVLDPQPAVELQKVELIDPESSPEFPTVTASGFRATLTVLGPGKVTLGVPDTCPNGFPFSFTALVIEP